jgi:two-component sensor histidine kinase
MIAFMALVYATRMQDLHKSLDRELGYFLNSTSKAIVLPLWNFDIDACNDIVTGEMDYPDLWSISVYKEDGTLVGKAEREGRGSISASEKNALPEKDSAKEFRRSKDIVHEGRTIGKIELALTDRFAKANLLDEIWRSAGLASLIFAAGIIGLYLSIELGIIRRLLKLRNSLASFSGTSLGIRARVERNDEIGDIASDFNSLAGRIQTNTDRLENLLNEKAVLIREIHHRVKNNLQIIASIIALQERSIQDEADKALNLDMQLRVRSMAHLHELLYGSGDFSYIDPAKYLSDIVNELLNAFSNGRVKIRIEAMSDIIKIDEAIPFGLIVVELLTNAMKYAYPPGVSGEVFVSYKNAEGWRSLEVRDEGIGLAGKPGPEKASSLGFTLVHSLSAQLKGNISIANAKPGAAFPGLDVVLSFPAIRHEE